MNTCQRILQATARGLFVPALSVALAWAGLVVQTQGELGRAHRELMAARPQPPASPAGRKAEDEASRLQRCRWLVALGRYRGARERLDGLTRFLGDPLYLYVPRHW